MKTFMVTMMLLALIASTPSYRFCVTRCTPYGCYTICP